MPRCYIFSQSCTPGNKRLRSWAKPSNLGYCYCPLTGCAAWFCSLKYELWEKDLIKSPFVTSLTENAKQCFFSLYTFISFPTPFNEVVEERDDTSLTGSFHFCCTSAISLSFEGIEKSYLLISSKGSQKREMVIAFVFSSEETSIYSSRLWSLSVLLEHSYLIESEDTLPLLLQDSY